MLQGAVCILLTSPLTRIHADHMTRTPLVAIIILVSACGVQMDMTGYGSAPAAPAEPIADDAPEPEPEPEPAAWPRPEPEPRPALIVGEPFGGAIVLDRDGNALSSTWTANPATKIAHADGHVWLLGGTSIEARRLDDGRLVASYSFCRDLAVFAGRVLLVGQGDTSQSRVLRVLEPSGELVHSVPLLEVRDPWLLAAADEVFVVDSDAGGTTYTIRQFDRAGQDLGQFTIPRNQANVFVWRGGLALRSFGRVTNLDGEIIAERPEHSALFAGDGVEVWYHSTPETGARIVFVRDGAEPVTIAGSSGAVAQVDGYTYAAVYASNTTRIVRLDDLADLGPAAAIAAIVPEPQRHHAPR